jgi:hypothetical protein
MWGGPYFSDAPGVTVCFNRPRMPEIAFKLLLYNNLISIGYFNLSSFSPHRNRWTNHRGKILF